MSYIEINNYTYSYAGAGSPSLDIKNLEIEQGELVLLCGGSGSGKTTLLRRLAEMTGYRGQAHGDIRVEAQSYGFVWQEPRAQMVCDKVEHEIVFGMENHGYSVELMQRRLAEVVTYFGLESLIHADVNELSSGEQQKVCVAAAMAMKPDLLLLDEPISSLDPIAAEELKNLINKIHVELGTTIVIAEHRADIYIPIVDRIIYIDNGKISSEYEDSSRSEFQASKQHNQYNLNNTNIEKNITSDSQQVLVELNNIWYRYPTRDTYAVNNCDFIIYEGITTYLVGGNGSGKSTLAQIICGLINPTEGGINYKTNTNENLNNNIKKQKNIFNRIRKTNHKKSYDNISYLPSDARYLFLQENISDEISAAGDEADRLAQMFGLEKYISDSSLSPMDISVGERQRLGLSIVLGKTADLYVLDEPTRGLDIDNQEVLASIIKNIVESGRTVLVITHDIEFAGRHADRIAMMYDGYVVAADDRDVFLDDNIFYTTASHRLTSR